MDSKRLIDWITEGETKVQVFSRKRSKKGPGSKQNIPFYNPAMELNRDISVLVCQWMINNSENPLHLFDGLAASGIRGLRFANEIEGNFNVSINDWNEKAYSLIKKNIKTLGYTDIKATNQNIHTLLSQEQFNYIDIDPFGSPISFIDSAMRSIYNRGVIACTATDTATLCGVYPLVCQRRYGAIPLHSPLMMEIGLRILLASIAREAAKYDKGIQPILSYVSDHYFRTYIRIFNGIIHSNRSISNVSIIHAHKLPMSESCDDLIGPLWMEKLHEKKIIGEVRSILSQKTCNTKHVLWKLFDLLEEEADAPPFFYTTNYFASRIKVPVPPIKNIIYRLQKKGFPVFRTQFSPIGFKTNAPLSEIVKMFKT